MAASGGETMYPQFDRSRLIIQPLGQRRHDLHRDDLLTLDAKPPALAPRTMEDLALLGRRLQEARRRGAPILALMGAHVIKAGAVRQVIDLLERGLITHVAFYAGWPNAVNAGRVAGEVFGS